MRTLRIVLALAILSFAACKKSEKADDKAKAAEKTGGVDDKAAPDEKANDEGVGAKGGEPQMAAPTQPSQPPPGTAAAAGGSEAVQIVEKVADEMCKCTDAECAQKVVSENSEAMGKMTGFTPSTVEEGDAIMMASKRMSECASKITM